MENYNEEYIMHYGVKGMKWGVRRARGHAGPGRYVTRKRQLEGDRRDLNTLNKGGHLSVGLTKKRQEALDKRDKAAIEKRIAKERKKISKQYDKEAKKVMNELSKRGNKIHLDAYNKAADKMNKGGIDKFNEAQQKKYGKDYAKRDDYVSDYNKMFEKEVVKNMNRSILDFYNSNKNYKKAQALVDKYDMTKWDDLAKSNSEAVQSLRDALRE